MSRVSISDDASPVRRPDATASPTWPLERVLFAMAGTMVLLSIVLVATISQWFLLLTAFVGINQLLFVTVGNCPASLVLQHFGVERRCAR